MTPGRSGCLWLLPLCSMLALTVVHRDVPLAHSQPAVVGASSTPLGDADITRLAPQQVKAGTTGRLRIALTLPEGYHLNPRAPLTYRIALSGTGIDIADVDRQFHRIAPSLPLQVPFQAAPGWHQSTLDIDVTFAYCRADNAGVCAIQSVRWLVPLHTTPDGVSVTPVVSHIAEAPAVQR